MSKVVSQRTSASSLRSQPIKRPLSIHRASIFSMSPGYQDTGPHSASATAAASVASRRSSHKGRRRGKRKNHAAAIDGASSTYLRPERSAQSSIQGFDRLIESDGDDGVDLLKVVERQDVFHMIQGIRRDLRTTIDTHLTWEELTSVDLNFTIVRPLAVKYSGFRSIAILYCLLLNRIHFQREANRDLAFQSVNSTRAALCELLSIKLLRTFSNDGLELVTALSASFHPLSGATDDELEDLAVASSAISLDEIREEGLPAEQFSSTLELAILSKAKKFISSPLCQRCIDGIWSGKVVLSQVQASHAIVNDSYKRRPLSIYDPYKAPLLNHLRLRVPSIRNRLEFFNFLVILFLYVMALAQKGAPSWTVQETLFALWLLGFSVDELAQLQERGLAHYLSSFYNLLDFSFCVISLCWLGLRISALRHGVPRRSELSFDCLALGAVLLCPRVASSLVQDNVVMLSLKAMISDFAFFTVLAMICFSGFAYAFYSLASEPRWTFKAVLWLMLKVWFGSSYLGFDEAKSFTLEFGPPLMILFTILSNTLLLTVLISLLSNTFQVVAMNASEEAMYQFACKTMAGITTDAIFSYQPPLNLLAVLVVMPLSYVLTPRWLHKINVFMIRLTSFPVLLVIRFFELHSFGTGLSLTAEKGKSFLSWMPIINSSLDGWNGSFEVIEAAFDYQPSPSSTSASDVDSGEESEDDSDSESSNTRRGRGMEGSWEERAAERLDREVNGPGAAKQAHADKRIDDDGSKARAELDIPAAERNRSLGDGTKGPSGLTSPAANVARPAGRGHHRPHKAKPAQLYRKEHEPRALGSLSSPLAKLYNRLYPTEPPQEREVAHAAPERSSKYSQESLGSAASNAHGDGSGETEDRQAVGRWEPLSPVARDNLTETRHLMEKLHEMEASNRRIEVSVLCIVSDELNRCRHGLADPGSCTDTPPLLFARRSHFVPCRIYY
ncbi:hypothetical protein ACQY0O_003527 [Thecaphora frezii]